MIIANAIYVGMRVLADLVPSLSSIASVGTQQNVLTGINNTATNQWALELQRGRYISSLGQATNSNNQDWTVTGITQSGGTLTTSATPLVAFNGTADFDPYIRGGAAGIVRLTDEKFAMICPEVGTGNVFKICSYTGGTSNVTIDFTINDGDTANLIDRGTKFIVINEPSANVYTLAATGLTRGNATPYVRVYDLDISSQTITQRGILYPRGAGASPGHGGTQIANLGEVGGKKCFASFYLTGGSSFSGLLHYAVYEYNPSTNTLVEVVGDTVYKTGNNQDSNYYFSDSITDGTGLIGYYDRVANVANIAGCKWDGTTFTIGTNATFGTASSRQPVAMGIRKYFNDVSDSTTQFIISGGFFNSGSNTGDIDIFPAVYNPTANTWDVSKFNTTDSKIIIEDPSNPTSSNPLRGATVIGQIDKDNGAILTSLVTRGDTSFRGTVANTFTTTNS
tara:strand:- start:543 stop:1895 length:1353 start_codon:yes stop_codon:yes gene_type:complete